MNRARLESVLRRRTARDPLLRSVRDAAHDLGAPAWLVGGYVRDTALRRPVADIDLVGGTGCARLVRELASRWERRGFRFRKRGVTTWRFTVGERSVDLVDASRRGLDRDLRRREFRINAIAFDLVAGRVVDPLGGLDDLRRGRIRLPRPGVLGEDPVRALRAARFLAELPRFTLDRRAQAEARSVCRRLRRVSAERVRDELHALLAAEDPARGLGALDALGLIAVLLPELVPLGRCVAGAGRPDVLRHTLDAIDCSRHPRRFPGGRALPDCGALRALRWALLLHDVAKPRTLGRAADGRPTFHGHETLGAAEAENILARLRVARAERRRIVRLIRFHLRPSQLAEAGSPDRGMRRLVRDAGEDLPLLLVHAACDARASGGPAALRRWRRLRAALVRLEALGAAAVSSPVGRLVDGHTLMRELGIESGPAVGQILARIADEQDAGRIRDRDGAIAFARRIATIPD